MEVLHEKKESIGQGQEVWPLRQTPRITIKYPAGSKGTHLTSLPAANVYILGIDSKIVTRCFSKMINGDIEL